MGLVKTPVRELKGGLAYLRRHAVAFVLLAASVVAADLASDFIGESFAERVRPVDLLLRALPHVPEATRLFDAFAGAVIALAVGHFWFRRREEFPDLLSMMGLVGLIRAAIVVLTPLATPYTGTGDGLIPGQLGMFPSGHTATAFLCVLLIDRHLGPWEKGLARAFFAGEVLALLLARTHYSIDVVGGMLLAYFVFVEWHRQESAFGFLCRWGRSGLYRTRAARWYGGPDVQEGEAPGT